MPLAVSETSEFAFMISVSGAVNWFRQGRYMMGNRMRGAGYREDQIAIALVQEEEEEARFNNDSSYEAYLNRMKHAPAWKEGVLEADRWRFAQRNADSDVGDLLRSIQVPVLAIFGGKDLNVDFVESAEFYRRELVRGGNEDFTIKVFENADHGLMQTNASRITGDGSILNGVLLLVKIQIFGKDAFAPGYIDMMVEWLSRRFH